MMACTKRANTGQTVAPPRGQIYCPGPNQVIGKNLFFTEKYLTDHSAHSPSIRIQVWLAAHSPERPPDAAHSAFWKTGSSPKRHQPKTETAARLWMVCLAK
ncbi:hypothetical protein [Burkholderia cepacia]|uniref:hypothetical protein n=1 Tax=Burkholderia cepacia TaxID=292 RepID=UPI002FE3245A